MIKTEKFLLGGSALEFASDRVKLKDWPHPFYTPFRTQKKPDIFFTVKKSPLAPELGKNHLLFDGADWKLFRENGHYRLELFDPATHIRDRSVTLTKDFSQITLATERRIWPTQKVMRPLLELVMINHLSSRKGLLLHGAAIRDGNHGYVFIGESGAGKTTISQLWGSREGDISILGDERIIIRKDTAGWKVYGTPWPGLGFVVENDPVPISSVYFIEHGKENKAFQEAKPIFFQKLFTQAFSSFWSEDALSAITETCSEIVDELPCFTLPFLKDPSVIDYVRAHVRKL